MKKNFCFTCILSFGILLTTNYLFAQDASGPEEKDDTEEPNYEESKNESEDSKDGNVKTEKEKLKQTLLEKLKVKANDFSSQIQSKRKTMDDIANLESSMLGKLEDLSSRESKIQKSAVEAGKTAQNILNVSGKEAEKTFEKVVSSWGYIDKEVHDIQGDLTKGFDELEGKIKKQMGTTRI